jgi:hypothetical protein
MPKILRDLRKNMKKVVFDDRGEFLVSGYWSGAH